MRTCPPAVELQQAYRLHTLQAARYERQIVRAIALLDSVGVEPLLAKGWAVARFYPERGLRPYGDIDLWVRPEQHAAAVAVLTSPAGQNSQVDLHEKFRHLDRSWDELYDRSRLVPLGEVNIRILGPEDHLHLLCTHMLYHGVSRPLWLCDVAAALEALPADFDWKYCLSGNSRHSHWVTCAISLAHQLLGARLDCAPAAWRVRHLPRWLPSSVLQQWGAEEHYMSTPSMAFCLRNPAQMLKALCLRWPNPVQATVGVGGPFNQLPRFPFQLAECLVRTAHFVARVPQRVRQHSRQPLDMDTP
ncbi:MAG: nucleotidyltransferase family protein [Anaerolineae bacterium]